MQQLEANFSSPNSVLESAPLLCEWGGSTFASLIFESQSKLSMHGTRTVKDTHCVKMEPSY
jgi:hypothetical protein